MLPRVSSALLRSPLSSLLCASDGISSQLQRVAATYSSFQSPTIPPLRDSLSQFLCRSYATRPVSRPKAHTGRTAASAKKAPTTSKTKAAKQPAAKKTTPKPKPTAKSNAKPRGRPRGKPAKKTKAKRKVKKQVLTEAQKKTRTIKALKVKALQPPTGVPSTTWQVFSLEGIRGGHVGEKRLTDMMKESSQKFKALTPEQLEHYNHIANQNKAANKKAYTQFIQSHSPAVIYAANLARRNLQKRGVKGYNKLQDDRQVKSRKSSYNVFFTERYASGDFKGLKVSEAAGLASREWKALSDEEKKRYFDIAQEDLARYAQEKKTVLNKDIKRKPQPAAAA